MARFPTSPPPRVRPGHYSIGGGDITPEVMSSYLNLYTYAWIRQSPKKVMEFWIFPTSMGAKYLSGYAWRQNRWKRIRIDHGNIIGFC